MLKRPDQNIHSFFAVQPADCADHRAGWLQPQFFAQGFFIRVMGREIDAVFNHDDFLFGNGKMFPANIFSKSRKRPHIFARIRESIFQSRFLARRFQRCGGSRIPPWSRPTCRRFWRPNCLGIKHPVKDRARKFSSPCEFGEG